MSKTYHTRKLGDLYQVMPNKSAITDDVTMQEFGRISSMYDGNDISILCDETTLPSVKGVLSMSGWRRRRE